MAAWTVWRGNEPGCGGEKQGSGEGKEVEDVGAECRRASEGELE